MTIKKKKKDFITRECGNSEDSFIFFFLILKNIYLAASGLSCSLWDLGCIMQDLYFVATHGLSCPTACGMLVP